jgi:hypothetical protein
MFTFSTALAAAVAVEELAEDYGGRIRFHRRQVSLKATIRPAAREFTIVLAARFRGNDAERQGDRFEARVRGNG